MNIKQHEVNWTPERISTYWDYISSNKYLSSVYFTKQVGVAVAKDFLKDNRAEGKDVLDFGCGPGNLFFALNSICKNINYYGMDFSKNSIEQLKDKCKDEKNFKDAFHIESFPLNHSKQYDYIICCEVIEHLDDKTLAEVTNELYKLLKPGGTLYVTTPNNEVLDEAKTMCPECGCVFHRWQHVRSWNEFSVAEFFARSGFKKTKTKALNFDNNAVKGKLKSIVKKYVLKKSPRNLVYQGIKN